MNKPEQILILENEIRIELNELDKKNSISDYPNHFELNSKNEIIGLNLANISIIDNSVLSSFIQLENLSISGSSFSDYSFFKKLGLLNSLSLNYGEVKDFSFLKDLESLRILDLSVLQISDLSFCKYLKNLKAFYLKENSISDISQLKKLKNIEILDLNDNEISDISSLKDLKKLKSLILWDNKVSDISHLKNLTNLTHLEIDDNKISDIEVLKELKNLTTLYLTSNNISDYTSITFLKNLTLLDLGRNKLSDISFIKDCTKLKTLNLYDNQIADVSSLKNLSELISLNLHTNEIFDISIFENLSKLSHLNISFNPIEDYSAIKKLTNLTKLDINGNNLANITFLQKINKLTSLRLAKNKITDLSPLGNKKKLITLDLDYNQILDLRPLEHMIKKDLKIFYDERHRMNFGIFIHKNDTTVPPLEVIEQGNETILQYFQDARKYGLKKLNECKLIFVGDGGLGKTSLMKKIIGLPFTKEETTHGINKKSWDEITNKNNENIKVNLWDFGGQHIQHSLHQFFLTEKVVYILLLNPRNDTNAMYWLEQIDKLGKDSEILIVYNWKDIKDKESHTVKNFYELRKTYPKLREPFLLSCKEGENFSFFKEELIKTILNQKDLLVQYPLNWFDIKKELEKDVTVSKNYIAYNEYDTICKNNKYTNETSKKNLLKQLDKIGSIVFFDKPILNDLQVLNPDWITTGAYSVITSEITNDKKGHLNYVDLNAIFKEKKSLFANKEIKLHYKEKDFQFIIALMTEYDLCVENPFEKNEYLIPCAFEGEKPTQFEIYKENSKQYRFTFESAFEMLIMYRFMARNISKCIKDGYWQSGIVIKDPHSETYALVETNQYSKIIDFWIKGENIRELWEVLRSHIKDINSKYSLKYKEQVLYFSPRDGRKVFLSYDEMIDSFRNGIKTIDYHPTFRIHNIDVLKIIDNFEDSQKIVKEMEKSNFNFHFNGDNHGQMQVGGEQNTLKTYINSYNNNSQVQELKDLLEEFEDISKNNKEWQDNFTNALTELYRLEDAKDNIEEKKSISKLQKFFTKAKEVKDWVAIGVLPAEIVTKGDKMIELGEKLLNLFVK
jgi:internalin A